MVAMGGTEYVQLWKLQNVDFRPHPALRCIFIFFYTFVSLKEQQLKKLA